METTTDGTIRVYTHRTGLLRAVGHDLSLRVDKFRIDYGDGEVRGRFWPGSITVEGAVDDGELDRGALSDADRAKIKRNIERDVLRTSAHPEVRFEGEYERVEEGVWEVAGDLEIVGVRESVRTRLRERAGRWVADLELQPSRWGIEPYSALMGSLKLEDRVEVALEVEKGVDQGPEMPE